MSLHLETAGGGGEGNPKAHNMWSRRGVTSVPRLQALFLSSKALALEFTAEQGVHRRSFSVGTMASEDPDHVPNLEQDGPIHSIDVKEANHLRTR